MMKTFVLFVIVALVPYPATVSAAPIQAAPVLQLCINSSGAIVAKRKCSKRESRFKGSSLPALAGSPGLNVYSEDGKKIGPLVAFGQTITEISGAKYSLSFERDGIIASDATIMFPGANCTGTPYVRYSKEIDGYTQLATALVSNAAPDRTLYLLKWPRLESITCISAYTLLFTDDGNGPCHDCPFTGPQRGFAAVVQGDADQLFPGPFDVRE